MLLNVKWSAAGTNLIKDMPKNIYVRWRIIEYC